jgi:hypothetical protein
MRRVSEPMVKRKYRHPMLEERVHGYKSPEVEDGVGQENVAIRGHAI